MFHAPPVNLQILKKTILWMFAKLNIREGLYKWEILTSWLVLVMFNCVFVRLTSWLLFVMFNCVFVTFPCGILGQVWYLIVSIPDLCHLSYFNSRTSTSPDFNVTDDGKYNLVTEQYNRDENESLCNRENKDIKLCSVHDYGKTLLALCIEIELRILNGTMLGDLEGKITRHKWIGSSTMDNGMVQNSLLREIDFFKVCDLMGH